MINVAILGTRGVPAAHGGFETFAERLALYLVGKGWRVTIYCQHDDKRVVDVDEWCGIRRVNIPVRRHGAFGTMEFDWKSLRHVVHEAPDCVFTLGYNTAIFTLLVRLYRIRSVINMDGLEWRRDKWRWHERAWLWLNERAGCLLADELVADHPEIALHLATRVSSDKITMIPYGADHVGIAEESVLTQFGLRRRSFSCVIARPEPENSILEIVTAFSSRTRGHILVVLGSYRERDEYARRVLAAASDEVLFLGPVYDRGILDALRYHALAYVHGHQVGGTNPSLVEALGAGCACIAHDNRFNRWVAADSAIYFSTVAECSSHFDLLLKNEDLLCELRVAARARHRAAFEWLEILRRYEQLLTPPLTTSQG